MLKINNKDSRATSMKYFWYLSSFYIELVKGSWGKKIFFNKLSIGIPKPLSVKITFFSYHIFDHPF